MSRLTESDYRGVLDVLRKAGDADGPIPFPEPVLDALRRLIPCDVIAYHEEPLGEGAIAWVGEPLGWLTREQQLEAVQFWHQDRLVPAEGARKISDHLTQREFHRLEVYDLAARPLGVEYMIRLWLDPGGDRGARFELDRGRRDFDERDRLVLDVLLPHLRQFRRRAARRREPAISGTEAAVRLSEREREVLGLVAEGKTNAEIGRVLWISAETVRKHLENAYEKLDVHTRTAAVAATFGLSSGLS
jgi:DNA-binding CsgD family transcriptional regulator